MPAQPARLVSTRVDRDDQHEHQDRADPAASSRRPVDRRARAAAPTAQAGSWRGPRPCAGRRSGRGAARRRARGRSATDVLPARGVASELLARRARERSSASTSAAGSATSTPTQRHAQVDQRHQAEVAQHPDVRQRQHAEAGDRGDPRGRHRGARAAVAAAQRLASCRGRRAAPGGGARTAAR